MVGQKDELRLRLIGADEIVQGLAISIKDSANIQHQWGNNGPVSSRTGPALANLATNALQKSIEALNSEVSLSNTNISYASHHSGYSGGSHYYWYRPWPSYYHYSGGRIGDPYHIASPAHLNASESAAHTSGAKPTGPASKGAASAAHASEGAHGSAPAKGGSSSSSHFSSAPSHGGFGGSAGHSVGS